MFRVQKILSDARLSGSLEFSTVCDLGKPTPPFLKLRPVSGNEGSALEALKELFANDPKMQVIQESDGKIRMRETDVPNDLLNVQIRRFSFPSDYRSGNGPMAVYALLNAPEVIEFMESTIGRNVPWFGWGMPGQIPPAPFPPGIWVLKDVSVSQALDRVAHRFPGFWVYENCVEQPTRAISVGFHENTRTVSRTSIPKAE